MSFGSDQAVLLDRLDKTVRFASQPTHGLLSKIIAGACSRIPVLSKAGKVAGIDRLVESGAWAGAALTLIALELPDWYTAAADPRRRAVALLVIPAP
jgi:hypothetical protein